MKRSTAKNILIVSLFLMLVILLLSYNNLKTTNDFLSEALVGCLDEISDLDSQIKKDPDVALSVYGEFSLATTTYLNK